MAERYLGPEFDIHGGGLDLRFPHHENEQAQSRAAGDGFARYWLHNGWVTLGGEKMSKSLGNTALVDEVVQRVRPVELRYYLVAPHYRSTIEFTDEALAEAGVGLPAASSPSCAGPPSGSAPTAGRGVAAAPEFSRGHGRRPRHARRGRRRPRDRARRATPRWPTATTPPSPARSARCARCSASSASTRSTRSGAAGGDERLAQVDRRARRARAGAAAGRPGPQGLRRRRRDPRPAHRPRRPRRGHPAGTPMGAEPLMAGNSQRRGRSDRRRQEDRDRRHRRQEPPVPRRPRRDPAGRGAPRPPGRSARPPPSSGSGPTAPAPAQRAEETPELLLGRNPVVEALRAEIPATALYVVTGDNRARHRRADRRGARRWPPTAGCRCSRWARPSSTGCRRARCTRASACRCRRTTTRTPTTCSTSPATPAGRR